MAFQRDYKFTSVASNTLSFTGNLPDDYQTGDMLIWFVAKDSTTGGFNTLPTGWTLLDEFSDNSIKGAVFYKENVTGGSETDPVTTNTDADTWSGVIVSIGGVATSGAIEANVRIDTVPVVGVGCERVFTGPTTLTDNALVLHSFLNSGINGCATDAKIEIVSEEVGYSAESVYLFKQTVPTAGASASGTMLEYNTTATTYIGISIADGSSGADVEPYQSGGGMDTLINGFQALETLTWMPTGFPSGLVTDAFGTYGNLATVNGALADRYQDAGDKGVSFFLAGALTRGGRDLYKGLRFQADRTGGLATYDISSKKLIGACFLDIAKFSVQLGLKDVMGLCIFLEDNAGNWAAYSINGSDSDRIFINAFDGPFLIDLTNATTIDSSGVLDETNIQYIGVTANALSINNINIFFSNFGIYDPIEIVGGTATQLITYDKIDSIGYANMHRFRKQLGGASEIVGAWHIGDGSVDTFLSIDGESIGFPEASNSGGCLIEQGFMGFKFTSTAGSNLSFINSTISSVSQWKWDQVNGLGTQTYTGLTLTRAKPFNTDTGDYSSGTFTNCATITQNGATMDNVTVDNCIDTIGFIWGTGSNSNLTVKNCTTGIEVSTAGSITFDNVQFDGNTTDLDFSTTGVLNVDLTNGSDTPTTSTSGGGTINITQNVNITAPNLLTGSRVQLYNVTKGAELDNSVVSGSYSFTVNLAGASIDNGDTVRLRATYTSGVTAKAELETSGVISASGLSFVNTQVDNDVYNAYGVDGSTITEFSFDSGNIEVDINDADNTTEIQRLACWEAYFETTEQGIRDFFGCIDWESLNSIQIVTSMCDLTIDNVKVTPLMLTGGRLYRSDGATVISSTSNSIQIDYEPVYIGNADDIADIKATIDTNLDATVSSRATVDGIWDEVIDNANHNTAKSAGKRLRQAGTSLAVEGTVDDVSPTTGSFVSDLTQANSSFYADQTCTFISGDLEGQARIVTSYDSGTKVLTFDEAWTVAPANGDEFEIKADHIHPVSQIQDGLATSAEIAALNNFDPAADVVANVALVDVTTANTDMRGTDNAATVPDVKQAAIVGANS